MSVETVNPTNRTTPAEYALSVTPSDSVSFSVMPRALFIGTGGDVSIMNNDNTVVTFSNVLSGFILPIRCRRVNSTGTTASDIVALF